GRRHKGPDPAARLQGYDAGRDLTQPSDQALQSTRVAIDHKRFTTGTHCDVEAVLRHVDTDNDGVLHGDPSLPNRASRVAAPATVRVRWNDGRGPQLSHGLQ